MCSFLAFKEIAILDKMLVSWCDSLPPFMKPPNPCPPELHDVRTILSWRYLNMRIILHRAVILDTTERQIPFFSLGAEEQDAVNKCRDIAAESIYSISLEWRRTKMSGWNAVWFLFQAVLIPLMALAVDPDEHEDYHKWQEQVVLVIRLCGEMDSWSLVGRKTQDAVQRLYDATQRPGSLMPPSDQPPPYEIDQMFMRDNLFGGMWNDLIGDECHAGFGGYSVIQNMPGGL